MLEILSKYSLDVKYWANRKKIYKDGAMPDRKIFSATNSCLLVFLKILVAKCGRNVIQILKILQEFLKSSLLFPEQKTLTKTYFAKKN